MITNKNKSILPPDVKLSVDFEKLSKQEQQVILDFLKQIKESK